MVEPTAKRGSTMGNVTIFDGHNDILSRIYADREVDFFTGNKAKHVSAGAMAQGNLKGGLFALFVPPSKEEEEAGEGEGSLRIPGPVARNRAREVTDQQFATLLRLAEKSGGSFRVARSVADIKAAWEAGAVAAVCHLEGCEAIGEELLELEIYYAAGLRSLGPVWSRHNLFGFGVPIYKEGSPDTGAGLTEAGRRLVHRCRELGIVVDLSHLTEKGFWDVKDIGGPLVASHSNAWELCRSTRNLTDAQLRAIGESGGLVGLNFGTLFLRRDGKIDEDTPVSLLVEQLRYMVDRAGAEHVGLGSDFDGTVIPGEIGSAAGLGKLIEAMEGSGFSSSEIEGIAYRNWLRLLED
ncbi:MAG: dipeptidase, partial [Alkalispirochaetaceae bacterium]